MKRRKIGFVAFFIGICVGFLSCNLGNVKVSPRKEQAKSLSIATSSNGKNTVGLKESVVYKGDTMSYVQLKE